MRNIHRTFQFSRDELMKIDRHLRFATGVLELVAGHCDEELGNADIVILEAQNLLFEIRENIEEKIDPSEPLGRSKKRTKEVMPYVVVE